MHSMLAYSYIYIYIQREREREVGYSTSISIWPHMLITHFCVSNVQTTDLNRLSTENPQLNISYFYNIGASGQYLYFIIQGQVVNIFITIDMVLIQLINVNIRKQHFIYICGVSLQLIVILPLLFNYLEHSMYWLLFLLIL